jgi:hypothetical protein
MYNIKRGDVMENISKEFWDDMKWGREHKSELLDKYINQWVAIVDKKVISAGKDLAKVEEEAKWKTHKKQIPTLFVDSGEHIYGQFIL